MAWVPAPLNLLARPSLCLTLAGCGQIVDDAVGAALGDVQVGGYVPQAHARVVGDAQQHPGVLVGKPQLVSKIVYSIFRKNIACY